MLMQEEPTDSTEPTRFSVVIPAYNAAATIRRAIATCAAQTLLPAEIIVVDDCSTDDTWALLNALRETGDTPPLILRKLPQNSGPSVARNVAIELASGDWIAMLDADDAWHPHRLEWIAGLLNERPEVRMLWHPYQVAPLDAEPHGLLLKPYPTWKLAISNPIAPSCVVARRPMPALFDPTMRHMEDLDLWLRLADHQVWHELPATLTRIPRMFLSAGGQSAARWKMRRGEQRAWMNAARRKPWLYAAIPALSVWGAAKQVYAWLRK